MLQAARSAPLTVRGVQEQLGKLGGSRFHAEKIGVELDEGVFMAAGAINQLRRDAIEALAAKVAALQGADRVGLASEAALHVDWPLRPVPPINAMASVRPELVVLCRSIPQVEAALSLGCALDLCRF